MQCFQNRNQIALLAAKKARCRKFCFCSSEGNSGMQVLCIGNPFGFDHTLTTGVISGVKRDIQSRAGTLISGGIQTDAAINPGRPILSLHP